MSFCSYSNEKETTEKLIIFKIWMPIEWRNRFSYQQNCAVNNDKYMSRTILHQSGKFAFRIGWERLSLIFYIIWIYDLFFVNKYVLIFDNMIYLIYLYDKWLPLSGSRVMWGLLFFYPKFQVQTGLICI